MPWPHGHADRTGVQERLDLLPRGIRGLAKHRDAHRRRVPTLLDDQGVQTLPTVFHLARSDALRQATRWHTPPPAAAHWGHYLPAGPVDGVAGPVWVNNRWEGNCRPPRIEW